MDPSLTLRIAVGIVQIHADMADVLALPVQPQHLVPELPHGSRELLEAHAILVVDALHPLLHLLEVRLHVRLHLVGQRRVHVVDGAEVPLVLTRLDLHEAIVVALLHDRVVHGELVVEVDVADLLRERVLAELDQLAHPIHVLRPRAQLLQGLLAEVQMDVHRVVVRRVEAVRVRRDMAIVVVVRDVVVVVVDGVRDRRRPDGR